MATIARTAKAGGGTNFNSGQTIDPAEVNTDLNTIVTEVNGNLDNANVKTATIPGAKSLRFTEISAPSSPSTDDILLYAKDNSGTTTLYTKDSAGTEVALGSGGTGKIHLMLAGADIPDASGSGNNPPELIREISSGTQTSNSPKATHTYAKFDAGTDEHLSWTFILPADWASGGTVRLIWKAFSATSGDTIWKAAFAPCVNSSTDDDALVYNTVQTASASTAPGTQGQSLTATIALTTTNAAASRMATVFVGRDADNGSDTMTGDAILMGVTFEYTKS